jgi:HSP20 family protein
MAKKPSFFDRLTGASFESDFDSFEEEVPNKKILTPVGVHNGSHDEEAVGAAQLTVDVYQTPEDIYIRALVAGVRPEDLDIAITRDMVTIQGKRVEQKEVEDEGYVYRELYWGTFARTVVLPAEVDVDGADASEKHGLLTIRLPKVNKDRQTKLKVKGN